MVETRLQYRKRVTSLKWSGVEATNGVLSEILSHLSVSSIRSFKTVNKYWYESVSSKLFAKKHLAQSRANPSYIACPIIGSPMDLYTMKPGSFKLDFLTSLNPYKRCQTEYMYMISSFNGLICCINHIFDRNKYDGVLDIQVWISNPSTREILFLPQGSPSFNFEPSIGVAYGSDVSDYKVFRVFCAVKKTPKEGGSEEVSFVHECEVYSSTTGAWENIGPVPCVPMYSCFSPFRSRHVFAEGRVCWLSSLKGKGKILSVDLSGRCEELRLPLYDKKYFPKEEDGITFATFLINLQGALAVVILHPQNMDVWVRNEAFGDDHGWQNVRVDFIQFQDLEIVIAVTSLKNQILFMTATHWWSYDMDTATWTKQRGRFNKFLNPSVFPFTESILPCKL
ncbi:unnamed protein product [Cochlearia groenlandica]